MLIPVILRKDDGLPRTLAASRRLKHVVGRHLARKKVDNCTCMYWCLAKTSSCLCCTVNWLKGVCGHSRMVNPGNFYLSLWPIACTPQDYAHKLKLNSVEQRVAIAIWCLATPCEYQTVGHLFGVARIPYVFCLWCIQNHCRHFATDTHPTGDDLYRLQLPVLKVMYM